jgi:hypothetical protein
VVDAESKKPSAGDTAEAILAMVAAGREAGDTKAAVFWLEHNFSSYVSQKGSDSPGALGTVVLAAVAAGASPTHFGGNAPSNDLVARLEATEQLHGASAGVFGPVASANAFSQSLAVLALASAGIHGAALDLGEAYLASRQCTDGGWEYSLATPCTQADPKTYTGPDTNSTSLAVMAIIAAEGRMSYSPLQFFESSQETDGSFGYYGVSGDGQAGDPDSTAEVVQALIALGAAKDSQFVRSHNTPEQALARFQYGCGAPKTKRGEFAYYGSPSQLATLQAVPAIAGDAFPLGGRRLAGPLPGLSCSAQ